MQINPNLPRVTEILAEAGFIDTLWFTDEGKERGTAVHSALQYLDEGDLDEDSVDPAISGYIESYKKFKEHLGYKPEWIELPNQDPIGLYRGTADRILITRPRSIDDIKTGSYQAWHRLQLAAYANMMDDAFSYERRAIYLKSNGAMPSIRVFLKTELADDITAFIACLNITSWKRRH